MPRPIPRRRTWKKPGLFAAFLLVFACVCSAATGWEKAWQRFEVQAHLHDSGKVEISERVSIKLTNEVDALGRTLSTGNLDELDLPLPTGPDQTIILRQLVREDAAGDQVLTKGDVRERDRYYWANGVLTWGVRSPGNAWQGETVVFRVEYELRNALAPAWDIPIGRSFFGERSDFWKYPERFRNARAAWKDAGNAIARRYRYEHEIRFAADPATGPITTTYTLHFDDAWVQVHPDAPFGTKMPQCYRITQLMEFQQPGRPAALDQRKPAVRVGSLIAVAVAAALLCINFIIHELFKLGLIAPRIDTAWFTENIASQKSEVLAWITDNDRVAMCFPHFLARMRGSGMLSAQTESTRDSDGEPKVALRLLGNPAGLQPYERQVVESLFPNGSESGTDVLAKKYAEAGFNPEAVLADAVNAQFAAASPTGEWMSPVTAWIVAVIGLAGSALVFYAIGNAGLEWRLYFRALGAGAVIGVAPIFLRAIPAVRGSKLLILFTIVWTALAVLLLGVLHFGTNLPLTVFASGGLGLYWIAALLFLFLSMRTVENTAHARRKRETARAAIYARLQLLRPAPALSNAWLPQLRALGLGDAIKGWCERSRQQQIGGVPSPEFQATGLPRFTGIPPVTHENEWTEALYISAKEIPPVIEKEDDDDSES